jgi:hypothetical protein
VPAGPLRVEREYWSYPATLSATLARTCGIDHAGNVRIRGGLGLTFGLRQEMLRSKVNHIQAYR